MHITAWWNRTNKFKLESMKLKYETSDKHVMNKMGKMEGKETRKTDIVKRGQKNNLGKDLFGQIRGLKEGNSFSATDPSISVQIRFPEIRFELIHVDPLILPRHRCCV